MSVLGDGQGGAGSNQLLVAPRRPLTLDYDYERWRLMGGLNISHGTSRDFNALGRLVILLKGAGALMA